jgi:hypothetical protein
MADYMPGISLGEQDSETLFVSDSEGVELARRESDAITSGKDLQAESDKNQHGRREAARDLVGKVFNIGVVIAGAWLIAIVTIWAYHLVAPDSAVWLSEERLQDIKQILTSVAAGVIFGFLIKDRYV